MKLCTVLLCLMSVFGFGQSNAVYMNVIEELNNYNTSKAKILIKSFNENERYFFHSEIDYLEKGRINPDFVFGLENTKNPFLKSLYYNALGDLQIRSSKKLTHKSHQNYLKSYEIGLRTNNLFLQQESLRRILFNYQMNNMNNGDYKKYADEYLQIATGSVNIFWAKYYHLFRLAFARHNKESVKFSISSFDSLIPLVRNHPVLLGKIYQMKDVCSVMGDENSVDEKSIEKSRYYYSKSDLFIAKKAFACLELNAAVNNIDHNENESAIKKLALILKNKSIANDEQIQILIANSLYNAYSNISEIDSALHFLKQKNNLEIQIKKNENYILTHEIDANFQLKEKNRQISYLTKLTNSYKKNKVLYVSIIAAILLISVYSISQWKKTDDKKRQLALEKHYLENEHTRTIEELKNVKKLIERESVILKDKTKVNLEQLSYIKADDHYLSIHTIEKRNHFVRGKLSEIIQELPSNFIKCHRSYIINKNHIKQIQSKFIIMNDNSEIPISRGFKI